MKQAVKTDKRAILILDQWLAKRKEQALRIDDPSWGTTQATESRCACGQTKGYMAFWSKDTQIAKVAVCEGCGDDDAFENEVIDIKTNNKNE